MTITCRNNIWNADSLRTRFSLALSDMYRKEVPLYADLVQIVRDVDSSILKSQGKELGDLPTRNLIERHGAIRLGSESEMRTIKRLFAVYGMFPVGYYDLQTVNLPLHATAFRPISEDSLARNPFRVFTSVLRKDLISLTMREMVERLLAQRTLFSARLLEILNNAESGATLTKQDAEDLITESLKIFKWHSLSTVTFDDYILLKQEHPILADIVCFPSAHINHLTPRSLNIDLVQKEMLRKGLPAKERIEGPPDRHCPILLRQTSFRALEEPVSFPAKAGDVVKSTHTARFGEVEQRGAAVTQKGRNLYDQLLSDALEKASGGAVGFDDALAEAFSRYPDTWAELQRQGLVYYSYRVNREVLKACGKDLLAEQPMHVPLKDLIGAHIVEYEPITYEDFLPLSAAGIFRSNLEKVGPTTASDKALGLKDMELGLWKLEAALGCSVLDELSLYTKLQSDSIQRCAQVLGLDSISLE
jgi:uncharacterized glyoxalase superfamily metalloenzyme YdcJ